MSFHIIPLIIPIIKNSKIKSYAYKALSSYENSKCKTYLVKALDQNKDEQVIGGILEALSTQFLAGDLQVQKKILAIYYSDISLSEHTQINLIKVLSQFPNEETIALAVDILNQKNPRLSRIATKLLIHLNYPAEDIANIYLQNLRSKDSKELRSAFIVLCDSSIFTEFLPDQKELLELFVEAHTIHPDLHIAPWVFPAILNQYSEETPDNILQYLSDPNPGVVKGILYLIYYLIDQNNINIDPFITERMQQKYLEFLDAKDKKIVSTTFILIQQIGRRKKGKGYIPKLLAKINFVTNSSNTLSLMSTINTILRNEIYDPVINDIYLEAIKSSNNRIRYFAIDGLKLSNDPQLLKSLSFLQDDPCKDVQGAWNKINT